MNRTLRLSLLALLAMLVLGTVAALVSLRLGLAPVGNAKVVVNSLLGRGIDSPAEHVIASRLAAADGFTVELYAAELWRRRERRERAV